MPMKQATIDGLNRIVDNHSMIGGDDCSAERVGCHVANIRGFLNIVRKLGEPVGRGPRPEMTPAERAILSKAVADAHALIRAQR